MTSNSNQYGVVRKLSYVLIEQYLQYFNYGDFAIIKGNAGLNSYKISVKEWVQKTNAIGIVSKEGRYGGTNAQKDIEFAKVKQLIYLIRSSYFKKILRIIHF